MSIKAEGRSYQDQIRGVQDHQESLEADLYRDTRSLSQKISAWASKREGVSAALLAHGLMVLFIPALGFPLLLTAAVLTWLAFRNKEWVPFKFPAQSGLKDPHDPHPKTGAPQTAEGIFFLGNDRSTGKELWLSNSDCRQHFLIFGTTGSGKTELLLGFAANALSMGSGFLFCDGKGDVSLFAKVYVLARRFGREDDFLVLNFMTGNSDVAFQGGKKLSNTLNPFTRSSSDAMTQMLVSMMDEVSGEGGMWKGRAQAMLTGIMRALTWLRDKGRIEIDVATIREYLELARIVDLADPTIHPDMPTQVRAAVESYLTSLPGFRRESGAKQQNTALDQHGYLQMQFTKILGSLADVYGHIFLTQQGDIDMYDVVVNRRILVVMLPILEKSSDEVANLGKIVVANVKAMMATTLGNQIEGEWDSVVDKRVTNAPSPFLAIFDEVGYYTVDGMAVMAAQARSLGFSLVFAAQDAPSMRRRLEKEADSIEGNTNTKVIMKIEDSGETAKRSIAAAGKGRVTRVGGYSAGQNTSAYKDGLDARVEERDRIDFLDLKGQTSGEMHVLSGQELVRAKAFYANPENAIDLKSIDLGANHLISVGRPTVQELNSARRLPKIMNRILSKGFAEAMMGDAKRWLSMQDGAAHEVSTLAGVMATRGKMPAIELSCAALSKLARDVRVLGDRLGEDIDRVQSGGHFGGITVVGDDDDDDDELTSDPMDLVTGLLDQKKAVPADPDDDQPLSEEELRSIANLDKEVDPLQVAQEHRVSVDGAERELKDLASRSSQISLGYDVLKQFDFDASYEEEKEIERRINETINNSSMRFEPKADNQEESTGSTEERLRGLDSELMKRTGLLSAPAPVEEKTSGDDEGDDDDDDDVLNQISQPLLKDPEGEEDE